MDDQLDQDEDLQLATTLDNASAHKFTLATSKFLTQVVNVYSDNTPFLAAECASKVLKLNNRLTKMGNTQTTSKQFQKFQRSICPKCKTMLVCGRTAKLEWQSNAAILKRFGGEKRLRKLTQHHEQGLPLSKKVKKIYQRYLKKSSQFDGSRLLIACATCGHQIKISIQPVINQKSSKQVIDSTLIGVTLEMDNKRKKKRKRRKKLPNAGLNITGQGSFIETPTSAIDHNIDQRSQSTDKKSVKKTKAFFTSTPVNSVTPRPDEGSFSMTGGSNQNKKRMKSKLQKLLAAEQEKKEKRPSFGTASALSSFLESL